MMAHLLQCYPKKFSGNMLRPSIWLYLLYSFVCPVIQRVVAAVNSPTTTMMTTTAAATTTPHHQRRRGRGRLSASRRSTATTTTSTTYVPAACRGMTMVTIPACSPQRYDNDSDGCLQPPHGDAHHLQSNDGDFNDVHIWPLPMEH